MRANTIKFDKSLSKNDNSPLIEEGIPFPIIKSKKKLASTFKKMSLSLFNENSTFEKKIKIKKYKTSNKELNNKTSYIYSEKKKGSINTYKLRKNHNILNIENFLNYKNKKNKNQKILFMPNLLQIRLQRKIENINHIIDKLNSPIFINIKVGLD